jgi:TPP-dependent pyruvate/acetoin dehydrogenase alpha subunit
VTDEKDCLRDFSALLLKNDVVTESEVRQMYDKYEKEAREAQEQVRHEPNPLPESIWEHIYANGENADWRKF